MIKQIFGDAFPLNHNNIKAPKLDWCRHFSDLNVQMFKPTNCCGNCIGFLNIGIFLTYVGCFSSNTTYNTGVVQVFGSQ